MKLLMPSQKFELLKLFFVGTLLTLSITFSYLYFTSKTEPLVIAIESSQLRILNKNETYPKELYSFIEMFLTKSYDFNYLNIKNNIETSSNLMTAELWEKKKSDVISFLDKMVTQKISSKLLDIKSITPISTTEVNAIIINEIQSVDKKQLRTLNLKILLNIKSERNKDNPSIYEVASIEESDAI